MISLKPYSKSHYIDQTKRLKVVTIPCCNDNYTFLILSPNNNEAALVDCADHKMALKILSELNLSLKTIILTHHHFDHVDGLDVLLDQFPQADFYCTETDQKRQVFSSKGQWVQEGEKINIFGEMATVIFTPGHTTSHVSYHLKESDALFCGDLIFSLGCGRVFEAYDKVYEDFFNSLKKIKNQTNDGTLIFCAHEYTKNNLEFHHSINSIKPNTLKKLQSRISKFNNERSIPSTMSFEKENNAFLLAKDHRAFKELRLLKNLF